MEPSTRLRDWWRWAAVVCLIGSLPLIVVTVRRQRGPWALLAMLVTAGEWVCLLMAGAQPRGSAPANLPAALFILLWLAALALAWSFPAAAEPTTRAERRLARQATRAAWPPATERARQFPARYGLAAYVAALAGALLVALALRGAGVHIGLAVGVMVIDALLLSSLVPLIARRHLGPGDFGLRRTRPGAGAVLAVGALVLYLGLAAVWTLAVIHPANSTQSFSKQLSIAAHPGALAVILDSFALAVCAPVCEEIFFRGLLFRSLRNRLPLWAAALIAGSLFGLAHVGGYPLDTIPIKMLFGVLMCLLYERTGSLLPCIAVHSFVDGSSADALFAGNLDIALTLTGLALVSIGLRTMISASREVRARSVAPAVAEPGAQWPPPYRGDD
jgi:membrane protease YdiL (CAAX protease family)